MRVLVKTAGAADGLLPVVRSISESLDPKLFLDIQLLKGEFRRATKGVEVAATVINMLGAGSVVAGGAGTRGISGVCGFGTDEGDCDSHCAGSAAVGCAVVDTAAVLLAGVAGSAGWSRSDGGRSRSCCDRCCRGEQS